MYVKKKTRPTSLILAIHCKITIAVRSRVIILLFRVCDQWRCASCAGGAQPATAHCGTDWTRYSSGYTHTHTHREKFRFCGGSRGAWWGAGGGRERRSARRPPLDDRVAYIATESRRRRGPPEHDRDPMELAASNVTAASTPLNATAAVAATGRSPGLGIHVVPYTIGVFGNLLALFILHRTRSSSNQKHGFMLRCLATNDCIALAGMLCQMFVSIYFPSVKQNVWFCRSRVLWRFFGLGSGCVAVVMAVERWLALTKPFFYQKVRTYLYLLRILVG